MGDSGAGNLQSNPQHRFLEKLAIFTFGNRLSVGTDQLHGVTRQGTVSVKLHRRVKRGLAAHRRQNCVGLFALDNCFDHFGRDRLDIRAIGKLRIRHDGCRIRVHQHDLIAFLAQGFAGLHPGIIKFAALPDHDWTGADEQNFFEFVIPRHLRGANFRRN